MNSEVNQRDAATIHQHLVADCEQAVVGERHQAAAVHGAGAVDVLLFQAERTANRPVVLLAVPERAVVDIKVVAGPRPPAGELARRRLDGAVMAGRGILGNEIHRALQLGRQGMAQQSHCSYVAQDNFSDIELTIATS